MILASITKYIWTFNNLKSRKAHCALLYVPLSNGILPSQFVNSFSNNPFPLRAKSKLQSENCAHQWTIFRILGTKTDSEFIVENISWNAYDIFSASYFIFASFFFLNFIPTTLCNWTPSCCAPRQIDKYTWDAGQVKSQVGVRQCCKMGVENAWLLQVNREGEGREGEK